MFLVDEHVDYYRAIAANFITNPPLAMELQKWWRHTSHLLWQCEDSEDRDSEYGDGAPPLYWLASELGVTLMSVEYEDTAEPDPQLRPDNKDIEGVVIRDLDVKDNCLVQLMDHLSTFEDS
ncbi:hypothetical protein B0H14DRAFT_3431989 [Mycena olivaceomarginata]|nr:hypothetical protein B0H14DRAFT_3431989 [Mycena olivaceomarginata]